MPSATTPNRPCSSCGRTFPTREACVEHYRAHQSVARSAYWDPSFKDEELPRESRFTNEADTLCRSCGARSYGKPYCVPCSDLLAADHIQSAGIEWGAMTAIAIQEGASAADLLGDDAPGARYPGWVRVYRIAPACKPGEHRGVRQADRSLKCRLCGAVRRPEVKVALTVAPAPRTTPSTLPCRAGFHPRAVAAGRGQRFCPECNVYAA